VVASVEEVKLIRGISKPELVLFNSRIDYELGEVVTIPTWEKHEM
jgi:hypothetical protein